MSEIEQIKLTATYYNNLSVGLLLGGVLIPYLAIMQNLGHVVQAIAEGRAFSDLWAMTAIAYIIAILMALWAAKNMRRYAKEIIASLPAATQSQPSN
ncbi:hypothetical protein [Terrarubrum flagellatum]|uniref:hypothetical protein n=1 Tax=Terrirubrum flagellatum TaxID=2895980 RepID=UPI0031451200